MATPSSRLARKIRQLFPPSRVDEVISLLSALPDTSQSEERIQAAMIVRSDGNFERFISEVALVQVDWRDTPSWAADSNTPITKPNLITS